MRIGIGKIGNLATTMILEHLLDELADRKDIVVRVASSGPKMREEDAEEIGEAVLRFNPDLLIACSPNPSLKAPRKLVDILASSGKPLVVVGNPPSRISYLEELEARGIGYIIVEADPMIGGRREFLDPTEMALFNGYLLIVLSATGILRAVSRKIDEIIESLKRGEKPDLPRVVLGRDQIEEFSKTENPYALSKLIAAHEIVRIAGKLSIEGCFKEEDPKRYIPLVSAAHELVRIAALLADEAREIDKSSNNLYRDPHYKDGRILEKRSLMEKPK